MYLGYYRVVTDQSSFAYLLDVFVLEEHRGIGLLRFLMECIMGFPEFKNLIICSLATNDAHVLYRQFGFDAPWSPEIIMQISRPDLYKIWDKN